MKIFPAQENDFKLIQEFVLENERFCLDLSSRLKKGRKNFFILTSKLFEADEMDKKEGIKDVIADLKVMNRKHHFIDQINGFRIYLDKYKESDLAYYLLVFNYETKKLRITSYAKDDLESAVLDYKQAEEKTDQQINAALVSANNFEDIKMGYQNYFANTSMFLEEYKRILKEN